MNCQYGKNTKCTRDARCSKWIWKSTLMIVHGKHSTFASNDFKWHFNNPIFQFKLFIEWLSKYLPPPPQHVRFTLRKTAPKLSLLVYRFHSFSGIWNSDDVLELCNFWFVQTKFPSKKFARYRENSWYVIIFY